MFHLTMRALSLHCLIFYAFLSSGRSSGGDDRRWLVSLVDLVELDYEDQCDQIATASLEELIGSEKGFNRMLERDKAFGIFTQKQVKDIKGALTEHSLSSGDDILKRKVKLLVESGDTQLDAEQWIRLVTFGDTALHDLRFAADYDCGSYVNCTLSELHKSLERQQDEATLLRMKQSWEKRLPDIEEYYEQILPLIQNASLKNNYKSVEEYWDSLAEYEGGIIKARELWNHIKPLYIKLQKYVALRLRGLDAVGKPISGHVLRSLVGDDWSNIIEQLLPKHSDIYKKIHANLQLKDLGGLSVYKIAAKLITDINLGDINTQLLEESIYNISCPAMVLDWCKPNKLKVVTCKAVNIPNYMDAHETVMRIKYKQLAALHSNNTYILREANRYSAMFEAISGFASLLALSPHTLDRVGLYPVERFNYNPNHHRLVLQLITALRDLPQLNFYIAADEWRLQNLQSQNSSKIFKNWSEFRKNFSLIESSDNDFLGHPYVLFNKPFIGKFMGIILKYQVFQSFAEELISDESDLVKHIAENHERLIDTMTQGYSALWPEMISDLLAKRENSLEYTGLTDFYRLLDEYLDNQLDPSAGDNMYDYVEPATEAPDIAENEIIETDNTETKKESQNVEENLIDTGEDSNFKYGSETSTVGVLEIKNPVSSEERNKTLLSAYNTYWWIGVVIVLFILLLLIALIARKRHAHRKQLERQRKENTHA